MATVVFKLGTGVSKYKAHAYFSVSPDPYPNGVTVSGTTTVDNVTAGSSVTIRASEVTTSSGYALPADVYYSSDGTNWNYIDYLQSTSVSYEIPRTARTVYIRVGPATKTATTYKYRVKVNGNQSAYGGTTQTKYYPSSSTWYETTSSSNPYFNLSNVSLTAPTNYALLGFSYASGSDTKIYTDKIQVSSTTTGDTTTIKAIWGKYYYVVNYYLNDGSGTYKTYPTSGTLPSTTKSPTFYLSNLKVPEREGYIFEGWAYDNKSGSKVYTSTIELSALSTDASNPTKNSVYAVWTQEKKYRVSVYFNGGTYGNESTWHYPSSSGWQYVTADSVNYPLGNIPHPTRTGYKFLGWAKNRDPSSGEPVLTQYVTITPTTNGTIQYLHAVWEQLKGYRVHALGNGGTSPNGSTEIWSPSYDEYSYSEETLVDFDLKRLPEFTKPGYNFLGWAYRATLQPGERYFPPTDTMPVDAAIGGTITNIYAVYEERYRYNLKLFGNGGVTSSGATYAFSPGEGSYYFADDIQTNFNLNLLANAFTNGKKHLIGWGYGSSPPADGEDPITGTIIVNASETGATTNIHAIWSEDLPLFYWNGSDTQDNNLIVRGKQRIMTAAMWNSYLDAVRSLATGCGASVTLTNVSQGSEMKASSFNQVVDALQAIKTKLGSRATLPSKVTAGTTGILASQFNGTTSIKGALNRMIGEFNG